MNASAWWGMLDSIGFETMRLLVSVLWQSSVLLAAAALLAFLLRRRRASARHAVWTVALLLVPLLPLLAWGASGIGTPQAEIPVMPTYSAAQVEFLTVPPAVGAPMPLGIGPAEAMPQPPQVVDEFSLTDYPWALALLAYAAGTTVLLSLVIVGRGRIRAWVRGGRAVADDGVLARFEEARERLGLDGRLRIVESESVPTPMTVCMFRPVVLLPAGLAQTLSDAELRSVAVHELAHVKRRDPLLLTLVSLTRAFLFFHPLVWLAARQVSNLAEAACDDAVLDAGGEPVSYAKMLARLAEELPRRSVTTELAAGIVLSKGAFLRRVQAILSDRRDRIRKLTRWALAATVLAAILSLGVALALPLGEKSTASEPGDTSLELVGEADDAEEGKAEQSRDNMHQIQIGCLMYAEDHDGEWPDELQPLVDRGYIPSADVFRNPSRVDADFGYVYTKPPRHAAAGTIVLYEAHDTWPENGILVGRKDTAVLLIKDEAEFKKLLGAAGPAGSQEPDSQYEYTGPSGRRPWGSCSITGRVVSEPTGEPIGHATVGLKDTDTSDVILIDVARDGSFEFRDVPSGRYYMKVIAAGYQRAYYNPLREPKGQLAVFTVQDGEVIRGIELWLKPEFSISGRVLDENGNRLSEPRGIHVSAWQELPEPNAMGMRYTVASSFEIDPEDGSYALTGLDKRPVLVMAIDKKAAQKEDPYPPCYYPGVFSRHQGEQIVFDDRSFVKNVDIRMQKKGGLILEGKVTSEETGRPVPGALILVHSLDMLFDRVTAYTDEDGHYHIDGLGPGQLLVHVDATPWGFVRTRKHVTLGATAEATGLDFSLRPGVMMSGKFVDESGHPCADTKMSGLAYVESFGEPKPPAWTGPANKHSPKGAREDPAWFRPGQGDYTDAGMITMGDGSFVIQGMMPGQMAFRLQFAPKEAEILEILYGSKDIRTGGLETDRGDIVEDVTIMIGRIGVPQQMSFGPVIERTLPVGDIVGPGTLDLDTGELLVGKNVAFGDREAAVEWMREAGVDVVSLYDPGQRPYHRGRGLMGVDMRLVIKGPALWWSARPETYQKEVAVVERLKPQKVILGTPSPFADVLQDMYVDELAPLATYVFKTREGGMGILQIVGFTDDPPGVKIRYKMVQAGPAFRSFPPKTAFVPYADRPIIVDGNLAEWGGLPPVPPSYTRERESLKVDHAFWLAWHEDGLYGAVMVGDTDIQVDPMKIWDTDGFRLFLELDHARSDVATENSVTLAFAPCPEGNAGPAFIKVHWPGLPATVERTFRAVGKEDKTGTVAAWARTEDGYNLEFHIPAEVLEPAKMQPGTKIGMSLNVVVNGRVPYQFHGLSYEAATEPDTWGTGLLGQR